MTDPYKTLGISLDADDDTIRRRYLELVREFSPEHHPQRFAAIRNAYEAVRDKQRRVRSRLFEVGKNESIEQIIVDLEALTPRPRLGLFTLLENAKPSK